MPELVACPSCGCKTQVAEVLLGRSTRCISCNRIFVAAVGSGPAAPPPPQPTGYPVVPQEEEDAPPPRPENRFPGRSRHQLPLCPRCHRPVGWEELSCPHCSHLFDPEDPNRPPPWERRRDGEQHRGQLIDSLGTISLVCGVLGSCTMGLGAIVALATGIPALVMAGHDLQRMDQNLLDPDGRVRTESGRNKAIGGVVVAVLIGVFFVLFIVNQLRP